MKPPSIPKGWRVLRKGTVIRKGDKFQSPTEIKGYWFWSKYSQGDRVGWGNMDGHPLIYIRRKQPKAK